MNRRDFLKGAGAAIVPAAIPGAIWGSSSHSPNSEHAQESSRGTVPITAVVFDDRYTDCKTFADALVDRGAKAFATNADAVQLWYGPLGAHLAQNPGRVAGLTTYADFSASQACGRELNLAPLYDGEHDGRRSRTHLAHRLRISSNDREIAAACADASWATQLADALSRLPATAGAEQTIANSHLATATTPRSPGHPGYLNSWLLAPPRES
jgi:hypothetical protein